MTYKSIAVGLIDDNPAQHSKNQKRVASASDAQAKDINVKWGQN